MKTTPVLALALAAVVAGALPLRAQDNVRGSEEPIDRSIDPAKLTYDYLVDGNLAQDNPAAKQFKTLQAACAAAPAGTAARPTVIGIRPNVYPLPGRGPRGPSLLISKDYITLLGLTNNRRAVVLADNRGLMQGADDDAFILEVNATGFTARNLTIINYCNEDYEYPGDPRKNLKKRSDVITQGVALLPEGDKHTYENVAILGRLDTLFLRTARSYFKNVYIEGTDDWMGGGQISVWEDSTLVFPTGRGVMSASGIVFIRCRFMAERGMQLYKAEFRSAERPDVLIDCILPDSSPRGRVAWVRGVAAPRPSQLTLTYHNHDENGRAAAVADATVGPPAFTYSREMSEAERLAYNPWNLLRAPLSGPPDNWDPAGVRARYEAALQGDLPFRIALKGGSPSLRTGAAGVTLTATVMPPRGPAPGITWSTPSHLVELVPSPGGRLAVRGANTTAAAAWVPINATASNGTFVTAYVYVEPRYLAPPAFTKPPQVESPLHGKIKVSYRLDLGQKQDQSLVSWFLCDDAAGANPRAIAVSRAGEPAREIRLTAGYVGKYLEATVAPKHNLSDPGPALAAVSAQAVAATDLDSLLESPNFRNFVPDPSPAYVNGLWTVRGTWTIVPAPGLENGYGIRPSTPASLLFQQDAQCHDMQVRLTMTPEKTEGTGFSVPGSPADTGTRNLHADIYIAYDPRTQSGYALRFWRTTQSAAQCMFQLYRIDHGVGSPLDGHQVLSGVFKPNTRMLLTVSGTILRVRATNDTDQETLKLEGTIVPNLFGGAGVAWPRGSSNVYSRIEVSYPHGLARPSPSPAPGGAGSSPGLTPSL